MSPLVIQLIAASICAIIGFVAGILVTMLWSEKEKQIAEENKGEGLPADKSREVVARLWRNTKTGNLLTELDGKVYADESELSKSQRAELKKAAMDWAGWVLGKDADSQEKASPSRPMPAVTVAAAPVIAQPAPLPPVPPPPARIAPPEGKAEKATDKKGKDEEPVKPKTMVEQIDEILAEQIKGTPLENKGLRIVQDNVGVTVWVGLDHYGGIEDVRDPEIKAAVRRAVATWEMQSEKAK